MTDVPVISRASAFRMSVDGDARVYTIARGANSVPLDFLELWAAQHWDSDVVKVLKWPGKDFGDYVRASLPTSHGAGGMT